MTSRKTAIKTNLFAADLHHQKLNQLGDPLLRIGACIDFTALAAQVDGAAPRSVSPQGGRPPYPTEVMIRILALKRLYNLSDDIDGIPASGSPQLLMFLRPAGCRTSA